MEATTRLFRQIRSTSIVSVFLVNVYLVLCLFRYRRPMSSLLLYIILYLRTDDKESLIVYIFIILTDDRKVIVL